MFKRLSTSLTKPPLAVFFMKDRWGRVILYLLLIPLFLVVPAFIQSLINPGMRLDRYEALVQAIETDFILTDTQIVDGVLSTSANTTAAFDYFQLTLMNPEPIQDKIQFVFLNEDLAIYVADIEISRMDYDDINLSNYDFSDNSTGNVRMLASSVKTFYDQTQLFNSAEMFLAYFGGLFDYVFYTFLMALFMMLFTKQLPIPFSLRLKLSVYLTTIFVIVELVAILFNSGFISFLTIPVLYFWHFWAYRSIKIIDKGITI
ncbi:MAG: DUF1189 family protein [Acholeplasmataceae bacterium]|jgi:hypothetical protein|nr:DUF1189 family protein [Acholeplasmataceae bacterium]